MIPLNSISEKEVAYNANRAPAKQVVKKTKNKIVGEWEI